VGSPGTSIELPPELAHIAVEHEEDPISGLNGVERSWREGDAVIFTESAFDREAPQEFLDAHKLDRYIETAGDVDADTRRAVADERARIIANATGVVTSSSTYAAVRVQEPATQSGAPREPARSAPAPTPSPSGEGRASDVRAQPGGGGGRR
jgi:hypothetical protein